MKTPQDLFTQKSENELQKIQEKYNVSVSDFKTKLPLTEITNNGITVRMIDLDDESDAKLAPILGYLTYCCQTLGNMGETMMMHGLLNPNAGFLVIQDNEGKIQGQTVVWEAQTPEGPVLVLDGMEFYNDRKYTDFMECVSLWAEASPYENIAMGLGYNAFRHSLTNPIYMDNLPQPQLNSFEQELFSEKGINFVYTDTANSAVYIKQDGKLKSGFENTIEKERDEY